MNNAVFSKNQLSALLVAAGNRDVRYYLNGILFDFDKGICVSTNGHFALFMRPEIMDGSGQCIVPRTLIESAIKATGGGKASFKENIDIVIDSDVTITNGDLKFVAKPIDGKFPDYNEIIPEKITNKPCEYNASYIFEVERAINNISGLKDHAHVIHNGAKDNPGPAIVFSETCKNAFGIIMPLRIEKDDYSTDGMVIVKSLVE